MLLTTKTIQSATLSLECIYNIQGSNSLALSMLCIGDGITDDTFKE